MSVPAANYSLVTDYSTREQRLARQDHKLSPYLCLEDGLCRAFLQAATSPCEFEGVKLLFPFVREAVLMRLWRAQNSLVDWMYFAFLAGFDLGNRRPDLLTEILPDHQLRECYNRLVLLQKNSGDERAYGPALYQAFTRVVKDKWPAVPLEQIDAVHAEGALKSLRTGFAAATIGQHDAQFCDFYGIIPPDIRSAFPSILWRNWLGAPADSIGKNVIELLEHPLLQLSRHLYPGQTTEYFVVQEFLREHLLACGVSSETQCPASNTDMVDWVGAGINYGRRVQREQPETVLRIFAESDEKRLAASMGVVRKVVADAGGIDPVALLPSLKRWQKEVYETDEPLYYGREVERIALFADFAIWIAWCENL